MSDLCYLRKPRLSVFASNRLSWWRRKLGWLKMWTIKVDINFQWLRCVRHIYKYQFIYLIFFSFLKDLEEALPLIEKYHEKLVAIGEVSFWIITFILFLLIKSCQYVNEPVNHTVKLSFFTFRWDWTLLPGFVSQTQIKNNRDWSWQCTWVACVVFFDVRNVSNDCDFINLLFIFVWRKWHLAWCNSSCRCMTVHKT